MLLDFKKNERRHLMIQFRLFDPRGGLGDSDAKKVSSSTTHIRHLIVMNSPRPIVTPSLAKPLVRPRRIARRQYSNVRTMPINQGMT